MDFGVFGVWKIGLFEMGILGIRQADSAGLMAAGAACAPRHPSCLSPANQPHVLLRNPVYGSNLAAPSLQFHLSALNSDKTKPDGILGGFFSISCFLGNFVVILTISRHAAELDLSQTSKPDQFSPIARSAAAGKQLGATPADSKSQAAQ